MALFGPRDKHENLSCGMISHDSLPRPRLISDFRFQISECGFTTIREAFLGFSVVRRPPSTPTRRARVRCTGTAAVPSFCLLPGGFLRCRSLRYARVSLFYHGSSSSFSFRFGHGCSLGSRQCCSCFQRCAESKQSSHYDLEHRRNPAQPQPHR